MMRLLIAFTCMLSLQLKAHTQKMKLQKAIDLKLVTVTAMSLGGYQGFCIKMALKNCSKDSLIVTIEAGRRLNSKEDKNQDILITKEEIIALQKAENKLFVVKGYCCQSSNSSPALGAIYDVNKLADPQLVSLANYLNTHQFDTNTEQQAVWAISDRKSTANITSAITNDSLVLPLKQFVANLKGEELPWYSIITKTVLFSSGNMQTYPLYLKGKLNYSNTEENYVSLYVLTENGLPVCEIKSQWLMPCTNKDYELNLPIKGLAKGKYTVELKTANKRLAKRIFEI